MVMQLIFLVLQMKLSSTITAINNAAIGDIVASANTSGEVQLKSSSGADIVIAS